LMGLVTGLLVLGVGLIFVAVRRQAPHSKRPCRSSPVMMLALALALVAGYPLQQFYMSNRYESAGVSGVVAPRTVGWAQGLENTRIAVSGLFMELQYPYYGKDLT